MRAYDDLAWLTEAPCRLHAIARSNGRAYHLHRYRLLLQVELATKVPEKKRVACTSLTCR